MENKYKIAVFASGRGSNLQAILDAIQAGKVDAQVAAVICNKSTAGALELAKTHGIAGHHISPNHYEDENAYVAELIGILEKHGVSLIVLAGYLKKIPSQLLKKYKHRIINIHPALLPAFGGAGLYGHYVHEAVLAYGSKISGATVHIVDEEYDAGPPLIQRCVPVKPDDTAETLAARILKVEHEILPEAVQLYAKGRVKVEGRKTIILDEQ